jgi:hypothetical protein
MLNSTAASDVEYEKERVFTDEEFASMNRIKLIVNFKPVPTRIFTV